MKSAINSVGKKVPAKAVSGDFWQALSMRMPICVEGTKEYKHQAALLQSLKERGALLRGWLQQNKVGVHSRNDRDWRRAWTKKALELHRVKLQIGSVKAELNELRGDFEQLQKCIERAKSQLHQCEKRLFTAQNRGASCVEVATAIVEYARSDEPQTWRTLNALKLLEMYFSHRGYSTEPKHSERNAWCERRSLVIHFQ